MATKNKKTEVLMSVDPNTKAEADVIAKTEQNPDRNMVKYLIDTVDDYKYEQMQVVQKGYQYDPRNPNAYAGLYRKRDTLLPYFVIKQLAESDDLLSIILGTRCAQMARFGHVQTDRHKMGYKIAFRKQEELNKLTPQQRIDLDKKTEWMRDFLYNCGHTTGLKEADKKTLPQFLKEVTRSALLSGFAPIEIVNDNNGNFHSFRTLDFGTIYRAPLILPYDSQGKQSLQNSFQELQKVRDQHPINFERIDINKFSNGEYTWVQVINSIPLMAFTDKELIVHNYYPANEIQWNGYPFSPLEGIVKDITSHLNANTHNSNYWKNGRASRGFLTIQSDNITETELQRIRTQFNASINSVANSFRMPLFGVGAQDKVTFQPFDAGTRDQEFMYLSDNLARMILSAFGVDPSELPGLGQLSKPTFSQALSESSNEYQLQASRTAGFIPLLTDTEALMNKIMAIIDPAFAKLCIFKFVGLEEDDPQKESVRLQQDMNVHLTMNNINQVVEKPPMPIGGNVPLNPNFLNAIKEHYSEGLFQYAFSGNKNALTDPFLAYYNSGFFFQWIALMPELLKSRGRVQESLKDMTDQILTILKK